MLNRFAIRTTGGQLSEAARKIAAAIDPVTLATAPLDELATQMYPLKEPPAKQPPKRKCCPFAQPRPDFGIECRGGNCQLWDEGDCVFKTLVQTLAQMVPDVWRVAK